MTIVTKHGNVFLYNDKDDYDLVQQTIGLIQERDDLQSQLAAVTKRAKRAERARDNYHQILIDVCGANIAFVDDLPIETTPKT